MIVIMRRKVKKEGSGCGDGWARRGEERELEVVYKKGHLSIGLVFYPATLLVVLI